MRWVTSGRGWRLAHSLVTLATQLDELWPQGGPTDGTIGDTAHSSRRSDHNPNEAKVVTAIDVDEVVEDRGAALVAVLAATRDPRIKYIIHEGQIIRSYPRSGTTPWEPAPYTGSNQHLGHVHLSVSILWALYDSARVWNLLGLEGDNLMAGMTVEDLQEALKAAGQTDQNGDVLLVDGDYGPKTKAAHVKGLKGGYSVNHTHTIQGTAT